MAFTQKLPVWLASGVEPPEILINEGWKAGIKPPDAYFNYLQNTAYLALKELQEKAVEASALKTKVDKEQGKSLSTNDYTSAEKTKLAGIAVGANNYTHPSSHPASIITEDASKRFVSDAEKVSWDSKETPAEAQRKVDVLAGTGNTKTVKQLDDELTSYQASTHRIILSTTAPENPNSNTWWYEDLGESIDLGGGGSGNGGVIFGNASLDGTESIWFDNI